MRPRLARIVPAALTAFLGVAAAAAAAPVVGPSVVVTATDSWDPFALPAVAGGEDGGFLVPWTEPPGTEHARIYAHAFDAGGQPLGGPTLVSPTGLHRPGVLPSVAALPAAAGGGYLVAWTEPTDADFDDRVMARLLTADGKPASPPLVVGTMGEQRAWPGGPALVVDAHGVVTLAWSRAERIEVHRFVTMHDPAPTAQAVEGGHLVPIGSFAAGRGIYPSLAVVPGGVVVAALRLGSRNWRIGSTGHDQVAVRLFAADGTPQAPEHLVTTTGYAEALAVRVAADAAGRFVLVWYEVDPGASEEEPWDRIRAQHFAADGVPTDHGSTVVEGSTWPPPGQGYPPALILGDAVSRPDGTYLVTWSQNPWLVTCGGPPGPPFPDPSFPNPPGCGGAPGDGAVFARTFAADGTAHGEVVTLAHTSGALQLAARAAVTQTGWVTVRHGGEIVATQVSDGGCADGLELGDTALCLGGRFRIEAEWATAGSSGPGRPVSVTGDTGAFWFFSPGNLEMAVKVIDGSPVNGRYWVFFASLTDVAFELVVTDTLTGAQRRYTNAQGTMASRADTAAFPAVVDEGPPAATAAAATAPPERQSGEIRSRADTLSPCGGPVWCVTPLRLVEGRFLARVEWRVDEDYYGYGAALPFSRDTGLFSFFSPANQEVALKILDGRGVNGHFWVFYASLTDVEFDLVVVDTVTGKERTYHNPAGTLASRADVEAF